MLNEFRVEKSYQHPLTRRYFEVTGTLKTDDDLQTVCNLMNEREISSLDHRITWDGDEAPDGFEYVDYSFNLMDQELEKLDPPLSRLENDDLLGIAGELLESLEEVTAALRLHLLGQLRDSDHREHGQLIESAKQLIDRYSSSHVCDDDCRSNGCPQGR